MGEFQALQHRAAGTVLRSRTHPRDRAPGFAGDRRGRAQRAVADCAGQGPRLPQRQPRGAGRRADARWHRHDRRAGHRPVHEARARVLQELFGDAAAQMDRVASLSG